MIRHQILGHRFVRNAPRELEPGVLYISMEYATAVHCGCGERVVTPFTPTDWRMTFDGESVTLNPSVGGWNQDCRSHYVIERDRVIEAGSWSAARVQAERRRDRLAKAAYYGSAPSHTRLEAPPTTPTRGSAPAGSPWSRFWAWFLR